MTSKIPSTSFETGEASWLNQPDAGIRTSWKNRNSDVGLLDGAYFGLNGEPILDTQERLCIADKSVIIAHNPGTRKISQMLSDMILGKILVVLDAQGFADTCLTFPEAENNGWIQEKNYISAWSYLGKGHVTERVASDILQKKVPLQIYQVTKKGVGKIALSEREIQRPNILYFFGFRYRI